MHANDAIACFGVCCITCSSLAIRISLVGFSRYVFLCASPVCSHIPGLSTFKVHNFRMPLPATVSLKLLSFPCHCHANLLELIYRLGSPRAVTNASFKRIQCKRGAVNAVVGPNKSQVARFDETFVPSIVLK